MKTLANKCSGWCLGMAYHETIGSCVLGRSRDIAGLAALSRDGQAVAYETMKDIRIYIPHRLFVYHRGTQYLNNNHLKQTLISLNTPFLSEGFMGEGQCLSRIS